MRPGRNVCVIPSIKINIHQPLLLKLLNWLRNGDKMLGRTRILSPPPPGEFIISMIYEGYPIKNETFCIVLKSVCAFK